MNSSITMTLSVILIVLALVKISVLLVKPAAWMGFARRIYSNPVRTRYVALAIAAIMLWLLIRSGLDIVQIMAVSLFVSVLLIAGIAPQGPRLLDWVESQDIKQLLRQQSLYTAAWLVLLAWAAVRLLS